MEIDIFDGSSIAESVHNLGAESSGNTGKGPGPLEMSGARQGDRWYRPMT